MCGWADVKYAQTARVSAARQRCSGPHGQQRKTGAGDVLTQRRRFKGNWTENQELKKYLTDQVRAVLVHSLLCFVFF